VRRRPALEQRLGQLRAEVVRVRAELQVLEEQAAHVAGIADDATGQAAVAGTPLADREQRMAQDDARRARRQRDEAAERLRHLTDEQDRLLERLLDDRQGAT